LGSALAIALFLSRVKELIRVGKLVFQPRNWRKTLEFMLQEGLTEEDVFGVIARLEGILMRGPHSTMMVLLVT
jgi:hypothetical protein